MGDSQKMVFCSHVDDGKLILGFREIDKISISTAFHIVMLLKTEISELFFNFFALSISFKDMTESVISEKTLIFQTR